MATDETDDQQLQDLEILPEAELLAIPELNIAPGALAAIWVRKAAVREEQAETDLIARQGNLQQRTQESKEHDDKHRREEAFVLFQQTMHDVEERSERLLERAEEEELLARERLRKIDERALVLKDGRRAYGDGGSDYRDEKGALLQGKDKEEARALHQENPNAATWAEHADAERQHDLTIQMKEKVQKLRDEAGKEDGKGLSADELDAKTKDYEQRISGYEKEFQDQTKSTTASTPHEQITDQTLGGADYMAAYGGADRTTSYASTLDQVASGGSLTRDFALAASGQGPTTSDKKVLQPASPSSAPPSV